MTDDVGNTIEGIYNVRAVGTSGATAHQPPQGTILDLLYEVGNTANMTPYEIDGSTYYCGDKITDMKRKNTP